jgi:hypothetical protein
MSKAPHRPSGTRSRYRFSKKVGIGIGVCPWPSSFIVGRSSVSRRPLSIVCRPSSLYCKEINPNIKISKMGLKIFNWGLDKILLLC